MLCQLNLNFLERLIRYWEARMVWGYAAFKYPVCRGTLLQTKTEAYWYLPPEKKILLEGVFKIKETR